MNKRSSKLESKKNKQTKEIFVNNLELPVADLNKMANVDACKLLIVI